MTDRGDKAFQDFLSEAQEIVEALNRDLLQLDAGRAAGRYEPEVINDSFRAVHSLKGLSGLFGMQHMTTLSHTLESLLDVLRLGKAPVTPQILDLLFESVEIYGRMIADASAGREPDAAAVNDYLRRLDRAVNAPPARAPAERRLEEFDLDPALLSVLTEYEEHRLRENVRQGRVLYKLHAAFDLLAIDKGLEELKARLKPLGEVLSYLPSAESQDETKIELDILLGSDHPQQAIDKAVESFGVEVQAVPLKAGGAAASSPPAAPAPAAAATPPPPGISPTSTAPPVRAPATPPPAPASAPAAAGPAAASSGGGASEDEASTSLKSVSQAVRVDIRKLDHLMNVVGELNVARAGIVAVLEELRNHRELAEVARALHREARALERKLDELQSGILDVRMVPLGQVFDKLSRVVRKISRDAGKDIQLTIEGADTELDKLIVEELSDPLMHIIRNAIDHGIEDAQTRRRLGKAPGGKIAVKAEQRGNHVVIVVSDDGRGFDEEKILEIAIKKKLVDTATATELSRRDLLNLVFLPGFSTRDEATELSGRGVGMDVVKTNIAKLSGIIDIESRAGHGTDITITLPITLAIIQALIIRVAGRTYAVPLGSVLESLNVTHEEIRTIEGREVVTLRGQTLPLVRLDEVFRLGRAEPAPEKSFVVVVGLAQHRMGLVVDELYGQQDIVIKSLGRALSSIPGIAGATELGGQQTVLVLDVAALVEEALAGGAAEVAA